MFEKIQIANRGVRACAGERSRLRVARLMRSANRQARAAGAGDEPRETTHV
ncbi:hypothetical protein [Ramlibacter sp.]|uniref:hypothetical protein n=1 Tax=Ramlibacter sp. TaxID=1917967 RepID=UPI002BFB60F8|nr:hypothetical protein [Ramlibacter sp.]HWI81054.1 hypothetical protein [Ramlibacter sp.]